MTLCGIETAHKFLCFKSAFLVNTKAQNYITAARFANQIIELEPTGIVKPDLITKYKKNYQECSKKGTNAHKLAFDPKDTITVKEISSGYLCLGSMTLLQDRRAVAAVQCPLDNSMFARADWDGKTCPTCELCQLGQDSLGLNIKLEVEQATTAASADVVADPFNSEADPGFGSAAASEPFL